MAGDAIVVIDNSDRPIRGDSLCTVLTTEVWGARILGKSELARTPTNALLMATGNNLELTPPILAHNRDEEKEHPSMVLEWIRRRDPSMDKELKDYLFTDKPIAHA